MALDLQRRPLLLLGEDFSRQPDTLEVYDFDHTLVYTATPEEGLPAYERATGQEWPFTSWWGEVASLLPPMSWRPIRRVISAFQQARKTPRTRVVVVTGRPARPALLERVKAILRSVGVAVEPGRDLFLKPIRAETLVWKTRLIGHLLGQMPKVKRLVIWDDRSEHVNAFRRHDFGVENLEVDVRLVRDKG